MNDKRQQILNWQQRGLIKSQDVEKSLEITQAQITPQQWYDFISKSLILFGLTSLAIGIIFFFAYNWDDMSKLMKFTLVQGLIILSTLFYSQIKKHSHLATGLLMFIALLVGALFALFGQTYQTGKDPWQLFFMWSLFVIPIAYVSKNSLLWMLWLVLINLSLYLFMSVNNWFWGFLFRNESTVLAFAILNVVAALFIAFTLKSEDKQKQTAAFYLAIITAIIAFTWVGFYTVIDNFKFYYLLIYFIWMVSVYYLYCIKSVDVLILSAWSLSLIIVSMVVFSRMMGGDWYGGSFLMLSIILITESTLATKWLMNLFKQIHLEKIGEKA